MILNTSEKGLTPDEAERRLKQFYPALAAIIFPYILSAEVANHFFYRQYDKK